MNNSEIYLLLLSAVLRPVNEYKIAEKIESANKELFDDKSNAAVWDVNPETLVAESDINLTEAPASEIHYSSGHICSALITGGQSLSVDSERLRRVTFRLDLEEFEPEFITDNEDNASDSQADGDSVSESEDEDGAQRNNNVQPSSAVDNCGLSENNNSQAKNMNESDRLGEAMKMTTSCEPVSDGGANDCNASVSSVNDECCAEELEEICEVIEDFGLAEDPAGSRRLAVKENFDHNDDAKSSSSSSVSGSEHSTISKPPSSSMNKRFSITSPNHTQSKSKNASSVSLSQPLNKPCKHPHRRYPTSSSALSPPASKHSGSQTSSAGSNRTDHHTSDILKIQLNIKPCCEHKHLESQRLPRYCGYLSQYGLSKEQLERREARRERYRNRRSQRIERKEREESLKSRINEEAFESWLRRKMRTSHGGGGTRNMYDVVQQPVRGRFGRSRQF